MGMSDRFISDAGLEAALAAADPLVPGSLDTPRVAQAVAELQASTFPSEGAAGRSRMPSRVVRPRRFWRPVALGFAVAVIAIVVSLAGLSGPGGHATGSSWLMTVTPAQAAELDRVAAATAQAPGPRRGQWLYQRYEMILDEGLPWRGAFIGYHLTTETQHWTGGRVQRWRVETTQFGFDSPKDRVTYLKYRSHLLPELTAEGGPKSGRVSDRAMFRPSTPTSPLYTPQEFPDTKLGILDRFKRRVAADEARLPPSRFRAQFKAQLSSGLFGVLVIILEQSTSERQRAAAFQALAYVRDVQMLGDRKDIRGRTGLAIRLDEGDSVETLIVNRHDGNLLQDTQENFPPTGNHVAVVRTVYLDRAIVRSMTAAPGGRSVPYHGPEPKAPTGTSSR